MKSYDLIAGDDWVGPVHQLRGQPFGTGRAENSTIIGALGDHARARPNALFLTEVGTGPRPEQITFGEAYAEVERRTALLASWGLARGERVGVLGNNSIHFVLAVLAVLEAGAAAVLLSRDDPPRRLDARVRFVQMRFLLHDSDYAGLAQACASLERACSFQEFDRLARFPAGDRQDLRGVVKPTDGALVLFTSGTTGSPKAVVQSHYAVAQNARALADHHRIQPEVRLLCVLPLHHVNGLEFTIFAVMLAGGHTVITPRFDLLRFWTTVREHGIHIISLVPNLLSQLADRPGLRGREPLPVRYAVSAAAPLSTAVAQRVWERLGLRIVQGYGLSEVTNFSCVMPPELPAGEYVRRMFGGRRTCVGPCLPGQEVQVREGESVAQPEAEGEIAIRGHCVMSGYLHDPAATEQAFRGGWFRTGDLGYYLVHSDGRAYFHISGRIREIAKRSGAMVNLLEIDETLSSIPGVVDAGAAAFDNAWVGEELGALVVRERGCTLTQESIARECRRALPFSAVPKVIQFVDQIPRTTSGKIRRAEIAQHFAGFHDRLFAERDLKEE